MDIPDIPVGEKQYKYNAYIEEVFFLNTNCYLMSGWRFTRIFSYFYSCNCKHVHFSR